MKPQTLYKPYAVTIVAALLLSACSVDPVKPTQTPELTVAEQENPVTLDSQFATIADKVPTFAGFYYNDAGEPVVALAGSEAQAREAAEAVADSFGKDVFEKQFSPKEVQAVLDNRGQELKTVRLEPKIVDVKYSFAELSRLREQVDSVWEQKSVTSLDLDEVRNRVVVGVEKDGLKAVEATLAKLQLPKDAYLIEVDPAPQEMQTLRDSYRPLMGGLQLNFGVSFCTLGFNAVRGGVAGFVTNSHCTGDQTRITGTSYRQTTGETVGVEIAEARLFPCSGGSQCRWADAAFARHLTDNFSLGAVAPVGFSSLNILTSIGQDEIVSTSNPFFRGEPLTKIGRTTGRTTGSVSATCYDARARGSGILNRCQYDVTSRLPISTNPISSRGDSGSSVLKFVGTSGSKHLFELKGLLWGSRTLSGINDFTFSPMSGVTAALGVLDTDASVATFSVRVDVRRIAAIGSFGETPDFYTKVTANGRTIRGRVVESRLVSPYQMFTFSGEVSDRIPLRIELWDEDGGFRGPDDLVDINPGRSKVLDFTLNTRTGMMSGDISARTGRTINVAGTPDEAAALSFVVDVIR